MSLLRSHFFLMLLHCLGVAVFFAFLLKNTRRDRVRLGLIIFFTMAGASILLAWVLYPFPASLPDLAGPG
jgi:hypothetical protein